MNTSSSKWTLRTAGELTLFAVLLLGCILLFGWGFSAILTSAGDDVTKTPITAFFALLGSVGVVVIGKHIEQRIKIESEIREKKHPVYEELLKDLFGAGFADKNGALNPKQKKVFDDFSHNLVLWGNPEMIHV